MDLSRLAELKRMLVEATDFGTVWDYFMTHFGEQRAFIALGKRTRNSMLEAAIEKVAGQVFNRDVLVRDLLLTRLPEERFIHGGFSVRGRFGTVFYFEEIGIGLIAIARVSGINNSFARFTARPMPRAGEPAPEEADWEGASGTGPPPFSFDDLPKDEARIHGILEKLVGDPGMERELAPDLWRQALGRFRLRPREGRLRLGVQLASCLASAGLHSEAVQLLEDCARVARENHLPESEAHALNALGSHWFERGDRPRAQATWKQAAELGPEVLSPQGRSTLLCNSATGALLAGNHGEAVRCLREAIRIGAEAELWDEVATYCGNLAFVPGETSIPAMAQAVWLATCVELKIDHAANFAAMLARQQGLGTELGAYLIGFLFCEVNRAAREGKVPPGLVDTVHEEVEKCAREHGATDWEGWLAGRGLASRAEVVAKLRPMLEELIGPHGWLFDRGRIACSDRR